MEKTILQVEGMACEHCVKAVTEGISALPGVNSVVVSLSEKTVTVTHDADAVSLEKLQSEIEELGYEIA